MSITTLNADNLVAQAIGEMTDSERTRLEKYASARGLTTEQALVMIVGQSLADEGQ